MQKVVFSKLVLELVLSRLLLLKMAVAQLVCAKLLAATHVVDAKLVVAKLDLVSHMSKLVMKMAVPILVKAGKTQLFSACVCLLPCAGVDCCKLEVVTPS